MGLNFRKWYKYLEANKLTLKKKDNELAIHIEFAAGSQFCIFPALIFMHQSSLIKN